MGSYASSNTVSGSAYSTSYDAGHMNGMKSQSLAVNVNTSPHHQFGQDVHDGKFAADGRAGPNGSASMRGLTPANQRVNQSSSLSSRLPGALGSRSGTPSSSTTPSSWAAQVAANQAAAAAAASSPSAGHANGASQAGPLSSSSASSQRGGRVTPQGGRPLTSPLGTSPSAATASGTGLTAQQQQQHMHLQQQAALFQQQQQQQQQMLNNFPRRFAGATGPVGPFAPENASYFMPFAQNSEGASVPLMSYRMMDSGNIFFQPEQAFSTGPTPFAQPFPFFFSPYNVQPVFSPTPNFQPVAPHPTPSEPQSQPLLPHVPLSPLAPPPILPVSPPSVGLLRKFRDASGAGATFPFVPIQPGMNGGNMSYGMSDASALAVLSAMNAHAAAVAAAAASNGSNSSAGATVSESMSTASAPSAVATSESTGHAAASVDAGSAQAAVAAP